MKATTPEKYAKLLNLVKIKAGFYSVGKEISHKYVDACFDSRDEKIWVITMRGGFSPDIVFSSNHFGALSKSVPGWWGEYEDIADWAEAYLQGYWKPDKRFFRNLDERDPKVEKAKQDAYEWAVESFEKDILPRDGAGQWIPVTDAQAAIKFAIRRVLTLINRK